MEGDQIESPLRNNESPKEKVNFRVGDSEKKRKHKRAIKKWTRSKTKLEIKAEER